MNSFIESAIGLSDLPLAVLALIFSVLSFKSGNKNWSTVFFFTGISAILGTVAHTFFFPALSLKIIWTVLYLLLFESIRRFTVILIDRIHKSGKIFKYITIAEIFLYLICMLFLWVIGKNDILILVAFSAVCLGLLIYNLFKYRYKNKYLYLIFALVIITVIFQILSRYLRVLILFEHLLLLAALFAVYKMSLSDNS